MTDETTQQDSAAMSPASAGSGARLPPELIRWEWIEKARGMTFFAVPLDELSRDELLAVAGYLAEQAEQERRLHHSTLGILKAANAVSW